MEEIPDRHVGNLSSAAEVGRYAADAGAAQGAADAPVPGTDPLAAIAAARRAYAGPVDVAEPGLVVTPRG